MKDLKTVIKDFAEDTNCGILIKDDKIFVIDPDCEFFATDFDSCLRFKGKINPKCLGEGISTLVSYGARLKKFSFDAKNIVLATNGCFDMLFLHKEFIKKLNKINSMVIPVENLTGKIETIVLDENDEMNYVDRSVKELETEISEKCPGKIKFMLQDEFDKLWNDSTKPYCEDDF